tara:strand:+ start:946 stop:1533 length:588 start_codon:yes stop_codon:yes gene_type:complete
MSNKWTMDKRTGKKITPFEKQWGIHITDLAKEEMVTPEAIRMRVLNYGSPFQRKPKPSVCELMYGKTYVEIALEENIHPTSLATRLKIHGDAYYSSACQKTAGNTYGGRDWRSDKKVLKPQGWLSVRHPQHSHWRFKILDMLIGRTLEQAVADLLYIPTGDMNMREFLKKCEAEDKAKEANEIIDLIRERNNVNE